MKIALAVLLVAVSLPAIGQDSPAPASTAPSFWHRVGSGFKEAGQVVGHSASRVGQEITNPGSTRGDAFRPITPGASELIGIFPPSESDEAGAGKLLWPRIALTAETWGQHLDCWTFRAKIWTSMTANHVERFQICGSSPVKKTNDLGQVAYVEPARTSYILITGAEAIYTHPTTGAVATEGPNPPQSLFVRNVPEPLRQAQVPILARLLMVTGFMVNISGSNHDSRMWLAGYEPSGNKG